MLPCATCDSRHPIVFEERGHDTKERDCAANWLAGWQLRGDRAACFCWETDPFPAKDFPHCTMSERRYFHYFHIAKLLGVNGRGNRCKLPNCVTARISELYPDADGTPTKVGYVQQDIINI